MGKSIPKAGLGLVLILAIMGVSPWALHCADTAPNQRSPATAGIGAGDEKAPDGESDCVRGEPEPVLRNSRFESLTRLTATEEYPVNQEISLTIEHFGCAHFGERYHFKVKRKNNKIDDWRAWMNFAADRLEALPLRKDTEAQIKSMVETLRAQTKSAKAYVYNTEISMSEAENLSFDVKNTGSDAVEIILVYQFIL